MTTTDKPRIIIVCHPSEYREIQAGVMELGHDDVLVQPNWHMEPGRAYAMEPPPDVLPFDAPENGRSGGDDV